MFHTSRVDPNLKATSPWHALASTMAVDPLPSQVEASVIQVDPSPTATSSPPTTSPPNRTSPTPHSFDQPLLPGPDPCKHLLYFDMVIPNAKTVGLDHVGSYRRSLLRTLDELFKVDSSLYIFPYGLPLSNDAEVLKSGSTLGNTLSQLGKYFDGLRLTRDAFPPLFVSVLLGFNLAEKLFTPKCQAQLDGIGACINLRPLQSPKVSAAGWIFGSHSNSDPVHLEKVIQEALDNTYPGHGLWLGFCLKQLWTGAKKTEPPASSKASTPSPR